MLNLPYIEDPVRGINQTRRTHANSNEETISYLIDVSIYDIYQRIHYTCIFNPI